MSTGYASASENIGSLQNKGLELTLNTTNIKTKDFSWKSTLIYAANKNKILSLGPSNSFFPIAPTGQVSPVIVKVGLPVGTFWGYSTDGPLTTDDVYGSKSAPKLAGVSQQTGNRKYVDINGDGVVTTADKHPLGNAQPKFTASFSNTVTYKNFDLSFLFTASYGYKIFNLLQQQLEKTTTTSNVSTTLLDRWDSVSNPNGKTPKVVNAPVVQVSDNYIEDGSYIRLKSLTLDYNFSPRVASKILAKQIRLYVMAQNLITITHYSGLDPETNFYDQNNLRALGTATYVSTNDRVHKIYAQLYWGIDKANIAIDNIPTIPAEKFVDPTHSAANLVRESRFIRAFLYFNLVRMCGPVPLVLHDQLTVANAGALVGRTSKDSVYAQIITDLDSATSLPSSYTGSNIGRVTSGAAHALLAKVYVTRQNWADAVTELKKIITTGTAGFTDATTGNYGYDLFSKFSDAFQPATKNGKEHVFSAQFNGTAGGFTSTNTLSSFVWSSSAYTADIPADSSVVHIFDIADQRRGATFYDSLFNLSTNAWVKWPFFNFLKLVDQSTGFTIALQGGQGANSKMNFPVIRYAEVLLLYAEALNELYGPTSDAYNATNIVRGRAYNSYTGNGNYTDHTYDFSGLTQSGFRDAVFLERRKEFIQESQRWFDLVRRTDLGSGQYYLNAGHSMLGNPKAAAALKDTLFPIPQTEIDLYGGANPNFYQNPGW